VRVLKWIVDRIHGTADARETPIGYVPGPTGLELSGMSIAPDRVAAALHVERDEWIESLSDLGEFYRQFGPRLPAAISRELATTARRLTT
jgi:phosphoenolpyruvate carboxykinase (GTP)